jgi:autotransporter passenger strand-loop-strand repeat protein
MTTLTVNLSSAMQTELSQVGVFGYAVYFNSAGAQWTLLNPNSTAAPSTTIDLPSPFSSGKVYLVIESKSGNSPDLFVGSSGAGNTGVIQKESDISWGNAQTYDFRYDSLELTLSNASADVANLTEITGFGLPMELQVPYSNGTSATTGYNVSGSQIESDIANINAGNTYNYNYSSGPLSSDFRAAVSPSTNAPPSPPVFSATDWQGYVQSLETYSSSHQIILSGEFNGAVDGNNVYHNGGYYAYQLTWDTTNNVFWLNPLASSQIKGSIQLTEQNLDNSIYSTLGAANIYTSQGGSLYLSGMNTGANNQWGKVLNELVTGLDAGFLKNSGTSPNSQVSGSIDFNQNYNWNPNYAYTTLPSAPAYQTYDPYAKVFFQNSNAYGFGYQDNLMNYYVSGAPQISVYDHTTGQDVSNINLTLFADGEQPQGYTKPVIYDYIAPASGGYAVPNDFGTGSNIVLYFPSAAAGNAGVILDKAATITLKILTSDADGTPTWSTVTFDGSTAGASGLWQIWNITHSSSGFSATPTGVAQSPGSLLINQFPLATTSGGNSVSWYQIGVGGKEFNLYTTTNSGGAFINSAGQQAIDGLAVIQAPAGSTTTTFTVNFQANFDPSLFQANTAANVGSAVLFTPDAPVAGLLVSGGFAALANQDSPTSNSINTSASDIAFAWTGSNSNGNTPSWIAGYTNKINADDIARIQIMSGGSVVSTLTASADIDGQWHTSGTVHLNAGTYSVTMTDYLPTDTNFASALSLASEPLILNVFNEVEYISSGVVSSGLPVSGGLMLEVLSGGTADGTTVASGALLQVDGGGQASGTLISAGGSETIYGSDLNGVVSGGYVDVASGGTATNYDVLSQGELLVSSAGAVVNPTIGTSGTLNLVAGAVVSGAIDFAGSGGQLTIGGLAMPTNTISGLAPGDRFDLADLSYGSGTSQAVLQNGNLLKVVGTNGQVTLQLDPTQDFTGHTFQVRQDAGTGTLVTEDGDVVPCYCAGTLIATVRGDVPVEELAIGDEVVTLLYEPRPIKWIGQRSYSGRFAHATHILPICIKAGALDVHQPRRDLWVSPHHAMFLEGVLIEAVDLVNGISIVQAQRVERVDYFHIELDTHSVIFAEGALSESFVDDDSRGMFQNAREFQSLYPEALTVRPARYCAPRRAFGAEIEKTRKRIAQRAGVTYAPPPANDKPSALVIDSRVPELGRDGGSNAILDHMRALQGAGFAVSFMALEDTGSHAPALSSLGVRHLPVPRNGLLSETLRAHAGAFDLVYLHRVETAARCLKSVRQYFGAQVVYSVADLHHLRLKAQSGFDQKHAPELMHEAQTVALREISAALSADCVITHSTSEAERLEEIPSVAAARKVRVVPWAVPVAPVHASLADRCGVAFIGGFAHTPNADAARWLVQEIMPLVWREAPEVQCLIVGSGMTAELRRELTHPRVTVLGRVDHLGDVFERVRLTVAPLRFGAGLKDKVLRSMAAGLPCVGTSEAFSGMQELPATITNLCERANASDLATAIVRMHRDQAANASCAKAGLMYVGAFYNQSRIDALMRELAQPALDRHKARTRSRPAVTVLNFGASPRSNATVSVLEASSPRRVPFSR